MLQRLARRFVAGPKRGHALALTRENNELGVSGLINFLGEHYTERGPVDETMVEYERVISEIERRGLDAELSVKLSQLGLMIDEDYCRSNIHELARQADENGVFVWIDMEGAEHVGDTISIYENLLKKRSNVGIILQANLKRTEGDLESLLLRKAKVRLVKGAYPSSDAIDDVYVNYRRLTRMLFEAGHRFALGTHNDELIQFGISLAEQYEAEPEFQVLLGVREGLHTRLAAEGFTVGEYIPYGERWWPYFRRRVREHKPNAVLAVKDFFRYKHSRLARMDV